MLKPGRVDFKGINELVVTFKTDDSLKVADEGKLVKSIDTDTVGKCEDGDLFLGEMLKFEDRGTCSVRMEGYFEIPYSGTAPTVGHRLLVSDKDGKVKAVTGETVAGVPVRVVRVNTDKKLVGFFI